MSVELKPHQLEALPKIKNGSVLNGGVGSGKTHTALAYYITTVCGGSLDLEKPMSSPKDLIVITTARKRDDLDWEKTAIDFSIFKDRENSYGHVSITVDSYNNLWKYQDRENCQFLFDEQKLLGNGAWVKAFYKIYKKNQWIMLSATPADNWIDYVPLFVANGFFRNRTEFIEEHVIHTLVAGRYRKIKGYYGKRHLERMRDSILVDMPFDRHTTRHLIEVPVYYNVDDFNFVWKKLWNPFTDEPLIDVAEKHRVARKVVNSDPSRVEAIETLQAKHPRLIIFYNFDYELELLRTLHTRLDVVVAEWNGHRHEPVPETEQWIYLVQYTAGAEAWNCTKTDAVVYYSLNYSHKVFEQTQGRIDRMDTPFFDLWYYILKCEAKIDRLIWRSLSTKKNFHEGRNTKFREAA